MKKPKIKKRKHYYLVYRERIKAFKCYDKKSALMFYELLKKEYESEKAARRGCFFYANFLKYSKIFSRDPAPA